ncbi:MAG: UDP-N-acetylmuramoyl-L-alanyl-D-glutamate--2,6-diaminopimelate ligase [Sphingobacteriia bacterium]|nr:UDP-N-acetylmuramoyl-L-alanyl-D-glutamate--2,6-diaminopimelate ligase [Sphingobacteriia bacterium]
MLLSKIVQLLNLSVNLPFDLEINDLIEDSRKARSNTIYIGTSNKIEELTKYIQDAVSKGCKVIITSQNIELNKDVIFLKVDNERVVKSKLASLFYQGQPNNIYAVTGTNGKTSTVHFTRQILSLLNKKAASIGTLGLAYGFNEYNLSKDNVSLTTPGAIELHKLLNKLYNDNIDYMAMEASSHGLDQFRLDGVKLKAAAFTNFTRDHLDYHTTMESYFDAKARLFRELLPKGKLAVLNADIDEYEQLNNICTKNENRIISFGYSGKDIKLKNLKALPTGLELECSLFGKEFKTHVNLIGEFQAFNLMTSIGLLAEELDENNFNIVENVLSVPGRMEKVKNKENVYVDYAHTPDALEKTIKMTRKHCKGEIIVVFGCGGNRDKGKRSEMGKIACEFANTVIITDDNPRNEIPSEIRKEILSACKENAIEIADRKDAIAKAIQISKKEDIVLIAGKGHEKYQIIGDQILDFDDVRIAEEV